jgi:tight adherence protein B
VIFNNSKNNELKRNLFGKELDYSHYHLNRNEKIAGFTIGFGVAFLPLFVFFQSIIVNGMFGIFFGFFSLPLYQNHLLRKQSKSLLIQFTDLLDSLSNSYTVGRNTMGAFKDAFNDLKNQYGDGALIVYEVKTILMGLENNFTIEELLTNFAERSHLDDVKSFVNTFIVCNRSGGNLKKIVMDSRSIISDKVEIQMDIETKIIEKKNELNIMLVMPIIIVAMLGTLGSESITNNSPINIFVKIIAIIIFIIAYLIGKKIIDIKI